MGWKCVNGECFEAADGTWDTKAQCEAARIPPGFTGGQCYANYQVVTRADRYLFGGFAAVARVTWNYTAAKIVAVAHYIRGDIRPGTTTPLEMDWSYGILYQTPNASAPITYFEYYVGNDAAATTYRNFGIESIARTDGGEDNCGDPPYLCGEPPPPSCPPDHQKIDCPNLPKGFCCISLATVRSLCNQLNS